jgi:rhomboid family GlyGly-CTERM serine protease
MLVVALSMVVMAALQAMPEAWRNGLRYDRAAVNAGEIWRLVSGHFVHLGWKHLALNLAGLGLGTWLFGADRSPAAWLMATLISALACGIGLWWLSPAVGWCVGLSGILHGLMVVGFGGWILAGENRAWGLLGVVVAKLAWERFGGEMPWADTLAGGRVITDAHLWGAAGGILFLGADAAWRRLRARV